MPPVTRASNVDFAIRESLLSFKLKVVALRWYGPRCVKLLALRDGTHHLLASISPHVNGADTYILGDLIEKAGKL